MTVALDVDPHTLATQAIASDPLTSAWVAANAGSGKTFVLSRRVIRLLLAGVDPGRILCLTFTKAAAAEMAKRVFGILGGWTRLGDAELTAALAELEGRPPSPPLLARARQLFARALDTPGGLKIQTIHAFCERLLHQFPFEANVAGHFEVLDERAQAALSVEARRAVLALAAAEPDGALGEALKTVLGLVSDFTHETSIAEFVEKRDTVRAWIAAEGSLDAALAGLGQTLALGPGETAASVRREIAGGPLSRREAADLVAHLRTGGSNDNDAADRLAAYANAIDPNVAAQAYLRFFLKDDGEFRAVGSLATNRTRAARAGLEELLTAELARMRDLFDRLQTAELYESTAAMLRLAVATIDEYERRKRQRSFLDFEDLVVKSVMLLSRTEASRWVQYKLDRGIDHILIDEAQDTSPRQWQVIRALVEDFFAGEGAGATGRTIFAVGDEKQSIFSFQGAVPDWFARIRHEFGTRARLGGYAWDERELHLSFRSVPVILDAVDAVFTPPEVYAGLTAEPMAPVHAARRRGEPGRVVVWPVIPPLEKPKTEDWATPVDHLGEQSPEVQLAKRIAGTIHAWRAAGAALDAPAADGAPRPIRMGEILILLRTRGALSDAINRALKSCGIPIAGADRLALTEHIAVMDLCALGRVVLTPEDDLSLAALLKSPLVGLDENALFELGHDRKTRPLWTALNEKALERLDFAHAKGLVDGWRAMADLRDPHAFYARVLAGENGRRAFLARLGLEALDVLDEFTAETLRYEESNTPSLEGFLDWLQAGETEIKRDSESSRDEVRVMTVHGAKGLEADVVFLVDGGMPPTVALHDPRLLPLGDGDDPEDPGPLVWNRSIKAMPQMAYDRLKAWRDTSEEEYRRLLYVGMTRARDRLYVVGIDKRTPQDDRRWHALVRRGLEAEWTESEDETGGVAYEWRAEPRMDAPTSPATSPIVPGVLPNWALRPAGPPAATELRLSPSMATAGDDDKGTVPLTPARDVDGTAARERGRIIHRLLQSLPEVPAAERAAVGARYLAATTDGLTAEARDALLLEVLAVLADEAFAAVFAPGSRAEIDIVGEVETGRGLASVSGRIDRLAVTRARVLVVDYKTNRPAPERLEDVPPAYLAQLALYRVLLRRLYPGRPVEAALLWTDVPALMAIPATALDAAETAVLGAAQAQLP